MPGHTASPQAGDRRNLVRRGPVSGGGGGGGDGSGGGDGDPTRSSGGPPTTSSDPPGSGGGPFLPHIPRAGGGGPSRPSRPIPGASPPPRRGPRGFDLPPRVPDRRRGEPEPGFGEETEEEFERDVEPQEEEAARDKLPTGDGGTPTLGEAAEEFVSDAEARGTLLPADPIARAALALVGFVLARSF